MLFKKYWHWIFIRLGKLNFKTYMMKKLIFATILSIAGLTAMAQEEIAEQIGDGVSSMNITQDFEEISVSDLPEAVTASVARDYPTAKITKAYKDASDIYKMEVAMEDGSSGTLYADAEGNWIKV